MRIPIRFKLLGHTINVEYDKRMDFNEGATGMAHYRTKKIRLQPHSEEHPVLQSDLEQIFIHELLHHCFSTIEEHKLCKDEILVNRLAGVLHQAITTMEYDTDSP
jgi:predicted SprT family Zn-dependent metalloprotease